MNLPQDFLTRMKALLGDEYPAFLRSYEEPRKYGLRVNTLKISVEEFLRMAPFHLTPIPWTDNGFFYEKEDAPSRHPFYYAGLYYLQEPSAMAPAQMLPVTPGDRVLDLCAAPGGKATALAAKMQQFDLPPSDAGRSREGTFPQRCTNAEQGVFPQKGLLVANDISASRAKALLKNLEVSGVTNSFVTCTTPAILAGRFPEFFDKILVDAPCSGEGMFRKDIANANAWSLEKVRDCAKTQKDILNYAVSMLRPGGMLLYSTCTFAPEEDEQVIAYLLETHQEMEPVPLPMAEGFCEGRPELAGRNREWECLRACVRLFPHKIPGEGHFLALLRKRGESEVSAADHYYIRSKPAKNTTPARAVKTGKSGSTKKNASPESEILKIFLQQILVSDEDVVEILENSEFHNSQAYYMPGTFLSMDSCDVIQNDVTVRSTFSKNSEARRRPGARSSARRTITQRRPGQSGDHFQFLRKGLYLGEIKKNRFEPSQAFAMSLRFEKSSAVINLEGTDERIVRYLRGETIETAAVQTGSALSDCGWRLVCVNGYPLGWGKLVDGLLKNKYHPGWRMRQ